MEKGGARKNWKMEAGRCPVDKGARASIESVFVKVYEASGNEVRMGHRGGGKMNHIV